jgi:hypothetical protein
MTAFGNQARRVEVHFPPDQLAWNGIPTPAQTPTILMVRGDLVGHLPRSMPFLWAAGVR